MSIHEFNKKKEFKDLAKNSNRRKRGLRAEAEKLRLKKIEDGLSIDDIPISIDLDKENTTPYVAAETKASLEEKEK